MKEILIFILIVVLALVFLFVAENSSGLGADILKALRFEHEEKTNEEPIKTITAPSQSKPVQNIEEELKEIENELENIKEELGNEEEQKNNSELSPLSPYYEKITISSVREETSKNPSVIKLRARTKEEINITGWTIETRHGEFKIPQGMEKYQSHRTEKDIVIEETLYIYLIGDKSPLGVNFRFNNCLGYLIDSLYPRKSSSCFGFNREDLYYLYPVCQEYILDLRRCEMPDYSNNLSIAQKPSCTNFINENLNYSGCYQNYNKDEDFLENYWYIYTKSDLVEPLHDIVYLKDANGYLVDKYSY